MAEGQPTDQALAYSAQILAAHVIREAFFAPDPDDVSRAQEVIRAAGEEGVELFRRNIRVANGYPPDPEDFVPRVK